MKITNLEEAIKIIEAIFKNADENIEHIFQKLTLMDKDLLRHVLVVIRFLEEQVKFEYASLKEYSLFKKAFRVLVIINEKLEPDVMEHLYNSGMRINTKLSYFEKIAKLCTMQKIEIAFTEDDIQYIQTEIDYTGNQNRQVRRNDDTKKPRKIKNPPGFIEKMTKKLKSFSA